MQRTCRTRPADRTSSVRVATRLLLLALAVFAAAEPLQAQDLHPSRRPSPVGIAKAFVGPTYVKVTYGRPYMRDRAIFGAAGDTVTYLVPWGEVWRTGANEATELTTTGALVVAGRSLEPGTYSIFTVPGRDRWQVRFNSALGLDGTNRQNPETGEFGPAYDETDDVLRLDIPTRMLDEDIEQFTIELERTAGGADLVMRWERTEIRIPIGPPR